MARSRSVFIAFTTLDTRTQRALAKRSSFICGNAKTAHGKLRELLATTITSPANDGYSNSWHVTVHVRFLRYEEVGYFSATRVITPAEHCSSLQLALLFQLP